jgi:uncharacterized membrane protein YkgB
MKTTIQDRLLLISSFWLFVGWTLITLSFLFISPELIVPTNGAGPARLFVFIFFILGLFLIYRGIVLVNIGQKFSDVYQTLLSEGRNLVFNVQNYSLIRRRNWLHYYGNFRFV